MKSPITFLIFSLMPVQAYETLQEAISGMEQIKLQARLSALGGNFTALHSNLDMYRINGKRYPTQEQGLQALVQKPNTAPKPKRWIQTLREIPVDPWETPYQYRYPGTSDPTKPEIISAGPDQKFGTKDDHSSQAPDKLNKLLAPQSVEIGMTKAMFFALKKCLEIYKINGKRYPTEQQGLKALTAMPKKGPRPKRWMLSLEKVPQDSWGTDFKYKYPGSKDPSTPEIISAGPDKKFGTPDDISSQAK